MKQKIMSYCKRGLLFLLISLLFGVSVYSLNATRVLGDQMPMPFGIGASVVLSGSMEPTLSENDLLIVRETEELYVGQVIVFQSGRSLTVHRIIELDGDSLTTQGDANNTLDDPITRDMVKGEVVLAIPYVGILIKLIKEPLVVVLLLIAAVVLMERSFKKEKSKEEDELKKLKDEIEALKHSEHKK